MARVNAVSCENYPDRETVCRLVRAAGYDSLELSRPNFYGALATSDDRQRFKAWADELGLELFGFDCWVEVDPFENLRESIGEFGRAIDWAADLSLGQIISHDPWANVNAGRSPTVCLEACLALFRPVLDRCETAGLALVLEPHPDTRSMENAWAIDLVDRLAAGRGAEAVGLVFDYCHYGVGQPETYLDAIAVLGPRIRHLHVADGDARTYALHLPLGRGVLDLAAITGALVRSGFRGTATNDLYRCPALEEGMRANQIPLRAIERELGIGAEP